MTEPSGPDKMYLHEHVDKEAPVEGPLASGEPGEEDVETAQEADDLEQEPEEKRNRAQEPEPPRPETVGPTGH